MNALGGYGAGLTDKYLAPAGGHAVQRTLEVTTLFADVEAGPGGCVTWAWSG